MTTYQNLDAWKVSMQLVKEIYLLLKQYPKEELNALTSQTKRAAISIPSNIAEGLGRKYKKDTIQFLHIARGSICEVQTLLQIGVVAEVIKEENFESITLLTEKNIQLLNRLINYIEKAKLK